MLDEILKAFFDFLIKRSNLFFAFEVLSFFFKCIIQWSEFGYNFCAPSPFFYRLWNIAKGFGVDYPVLAETLQFFVSWKLVVFFYEEFKRVVKAPDVFFGCAGEGRIRNI